MNAELQTHRIHSNHSKCSCHTPSVLQLKAVADFAPHARPVAGIAFDLDDGNSLLSCSYDGSVRCLDVVKQVRKAAVW